MSAELGEMLDDLRRLGVKRPGYRLVSPHGYGMSDRYGRTICDQCGRQRTSWNSPCKCPAGTPSHFEAAQ